MTPTQLHRRSLGLSIEGPFYSNRRRRRPLRRFAAGLASFFRLFL